jgi:hypothetical protein
LTPKRSTSWLPPISFFAIPPFAIAAVSSVFSSDFFLSETKKYR